MEGERNKFSTLNSCVCPGYNISFQCTVSGRSGATIWQGSAFECLNGEILLRHQGFETSQGRCSGHNNIMARGVQVVGECYISELTITVGADLNSKVVECVHDDTSQVSVIGRSTVSLTTSNQQLTFNIMVYITFCSYLTY